MAMPRMVEQWTRTQVLALPDDGLRHELIDGVHIVSPAPRFRHQQFLLSLTLLMSPYVKGSGVAVSEGDPQVAGADRGLKPGTTPSKSKPVMARLVRATQEHGL